MNFAELLSALEEVSGFIASAGDTRMLDTAAKIKGGLALRFPGYNMDEPMYAVRFEATRSLHVDVPDGPLAEVIGEKGLNPHLDPPFTGNGFTASADEIVSEYHIASGGEYPPRRRDVEDQS